MIEQTQKQILFEEVAKQAITQSKFLNTGAVYRELLGISDTTQQIYGFPLAPIYVAKDGDLIDIKRIAAFLKGTIRDFKVLDLALTTLEDKIIYTQMELWNKMQYFKAQARDIKNVAEAEASKLALGGRWSFADTFATADWVDQNLSTTWIDVAEGIVFLPALADVQTVAPKRIKLIQENVSPGNNLLGSTVLNAFDALESTVWHAAFVNDVQTVQGEIAIDYATDITAIGIEPIGAGIIVTVEVYSGNEWTQVLKESLYSKTTFGVTLTKVERVRVTYSAGASTLPKVLGIKNIVLYTAQSANSADLYTLTLTPTTTFNELYLSYDALIPADASVRSFYTDSPSGKWKSIEPNVWISMTDTATTHKTINAATPKVFTSGVYKVDIEGQAINNISGELEVGVNQVEIAAFSSNWLLTGNHTKNLTPTDFTKENLLKTWVDVLSAPINGLNNGVQLQAFNLNTLSDSPYFITRGGNLLVSSPRSDLDFDVLHLIPLVGDKSRNTLQSTYNYRIKYHFYCDNPYYFEQGSYWFLQGFRQTGTRTYRQTGKSYGAFTVYLNNNLIAGDNIPYTIFNNNTLESGAELGKPVSYKFAQGWNTIEMLVSIASIPDVTVDAGDIGDPYLQISLYPSIFDRDFQLQAGISKILASGVNKPITDFDLIWNTPVSPNFWSWTDDRKSIYLNANSVKPIDGFLKGVYPTSQLIYTSIDFTQPTKDIRLRFNLTKSDSSSAGSILKSYKVMTR